MNVEAILNNVSESSKKMFDLGERSGYSSAIIVLQKQQIELIKQGKSTKGVEKCLQILEQNRS